MTETPNDDGPAGRNVPVCERCGITDHAELGREDEADDEWACPDCGGRTYTTTFVSLIEGDPR